MIVAKKSAFAPQGPFLTGWHKQAQMDSYTHRGLCYERKDPEETELCAAAAVDTQQPLREFRVDSEALCAPRNLTEQAFR